MTQLTIRPARREDLGPMAEILDEIVRIGGTTAIQTRQTAATVAALTLDREGFVCCHVAESAGQIAGFQWLNRDRTDPRAGRIATFAGAQARGTGTALFATTRAAARAAGLSAIIAEIRADNVPGLAFYAKLGFHDHSMRTGVPLADGTPVDRIVRHYRL